MKDQNFIAKLVSRSLFLAILILSLGNANAQVIFSETFDESNGSTSGTENSGNGVTWSSTCATCVSGDWWEVRSGVFEGTDTNGPASWTTGSINTSSCGNIDISFDITENGTMEACGTGCNSVDWVQLEYRIDGGAWQTPANSYNCSGSCAGINVIQSDDISGGSLNYSTGCVSAGNTLELRITVQTWAASEQWQIDNVTVTCGNSNPGLDGNVAVCSNGNAIDLFNELAGTPDVGGSWSGPSGLTNGDQGTHTPGTNGPGTYIYTVGPVGCQATAEVVVTENSAPSILSINDVDPSCGQNNGSIEINVTGGSAPINYSNDNGGSYQSGNQFTSLSPGTYDVVVEDANGCQDNTLVTLSNASGPSITGTVDVNPSCGGNNGSIEVNVSGGASPIEYSSDNGGIFQSGNQFTNLSPGTYDVVVEDANGCQDNITVTLSNVTGPSISGTIDVDPTCNGNNGSIEVTVSGGTTPIEFSDDNGATFQSGNLFSNLSSGTYDIVVEDANGCQDNITVSLSNATGPNITGTIDTDPTCGGNNGSIEVTVSGGATPIEYSNDNGTTFQSGNQFSNLSSGTYDIVVEDANGCQDNVAVTLNNSSGPSITGTVDTDPTCGQNNGEIEINSSNGASPLQFSNDNGATFQSGNQFTNLSPGTYDLIVEDANGCQDNVSVTLVNTPPPTFTISSQNPSCNSADGEIILSGLNPNSNFDIAYDNGALVGPTNETSNASGEITIGNLSSGTYTNFQVTNSDGCTEIDNAVVNLVAPSAPSVDAGNDITVCEGDQITLTASNPDGATISWDQNVTDGAPFVVNATQTYTVTADLNGCSVTDQVTVTVNAAPTIDPVANVVLCSGDLFTGVSFSADDPNATFNWVVVSGIDFGLGVSGTGNLGPLGQPLPAGFLETIQVTPLSAQGCQGNPITFDIQSTPGPSASFTSNVVSGCEPLEVQFLNQSSGSVQCQWDFGDGSTSMSCQNITHTFNQQGQYDITLSVTDQNGCSDVMSIPGYIQVNASPVADFEWYPNEVTVEDTEVEFLNQSSGATDYTWIFENQNDTIRSSNVTYEFPEIPNGNQVVTLIAENNNCQDIISQSLIIQDVLLYYVPNTFTPDEDRHNPIFKPVFTSGFDPFDFELLIFNRWGEPLFESHNANIGWDGTYQGQPVPDGTYVWRIEFKRNNSDERVKAFGHVNVLR